MRLLALLLLASMASAQTVYLRYGGAATRKDISSAAAGTPCVVTVNGHGYSNGQIVAIGFTSGMSGLNGIHKVKNVTANTFELTDTSDINRTCSGTLRAGGGFVGMARATTLIAYPRGLLDGPGGAITASIATKAVAGNTNYDALISRANTDSIAPYSGNYGNAAVKTGWAPLSLSLAWRATGTAGYKSAALDYLANFQSFDPHDQFGCDFYDVDCGTNTSSNLDWANYITANFSMGFASWADQMTSGERQLFADKMLNGVYGDSCTPTRVQLSGTVSTTAGSAIVTGSGTNFLSVLSNGQPVYVNTSTTGGALMTIATVDSDTQLTLTTTMAAAGSGQKIWRQDAWSQSSKHCGFLWWAGHHNYGAGPLFEGKQTTITAAMDAVQTTMTLGRKEDIPYYPVYGKFTSGGEWVSIDSPGAGSTVNVTRGMFGSTAAIHSNNAVIQWVSLPTFGKTSTLSNALPWFAGTNAHWDESVNHNLIHAKIYAAISTGAALCGVDTRACDLLQRAWNYWYDSEYYYANLFWTGINAGGTNYGFDRWADFSTDIALIAKNNFSPSIDFAMEQWITSLIGNYHIWAYLGSSGKGVSWADSMTTVTDIYASRRFKGPTKAAFLNPAHANVPYLNYFFRTTLGYWTATDLDDYQNAAYFYLFASQGAPESNINGLPKNSILKDRTIASSLFPNIGLHALLSRSDWSSTPTNVFQYALSMPLDHTGSYPWPGHYQIVKGTAYLLGDDSSSNVTSPGTQSGLNQNSIQIGSGAHLTVTANSGNTSPSGVYGQYSFFDRTKATDNYVYNRTNWKDAVKASFGVTRAYRELIHLTGTAQDYVIVYDQVVTSSASSKIGRLHYPVIAATGPTSNTFSRSGGDVTYTRGSSARILSRILLPAGATITDSTDTGASSVAIDGGSVAGYEQLVVHRPSTDTADSMPPVSLVGTISSIYRGVEIADATQHKIVLFLKDGSVPATNVTFAPSVFGGTAEILVTGLTAGNYDVARGGSPVSGSPFTVGSDGALRFTSAEGTMTVVLNGSSVPLDITTLSLPAGTQNAFYSQTLSAAGGAQPYTWNLAAGSLCAGLSLSSAGVLSGTPTSVGTCNFTVRVTDDVFVTDTQAISLNVTAIPTPLTLSSTPLTTALLVEALTMTLIAGGGTAPYTYSVFAGTLPAGMSINTSTGEISGMATEIGDFDITGRVTDSAGTTQETSFRIRILPNTGILIRRTKVVGQNLWIQFTGALNANAACKIVLRDNSDAVVNEAVIAAGLSARTAVFSGLSSGAVLTPDISCTTVGVRGTALIIDPAVSGTTAFSLGFSAPQGRSITNILLEYGATPALGSITSTVCASSCTINLTPLRGILYYRFVWRNSVNATIAGSSIQTALAP